MSWLPDTYIYLALNIGTIFFPLLLSFDAKVQFYRSWNRLFAGLLIAGGLYLVWDVLFTAIGVWSFNPDYVTGVWLAGLPLEEWLFFLTVPYACAFIYASLNAWFPIHTTPRYVTPLTFVLIAFLVLCTILYYDRLYTSITFGLCAAALAGHYYRFGTWVLAGLYRAWAISLLPFFAVNGVLTAMPVVRYNDAENMGIRIGTIPFEDAFYGFLLLLIVISVYEWRTYSARPIPANVSAL
jgi:lycopene cyclase domain-containing protein